MTISILGDKTHLDTPGAGEGIATHARTQALIHTIYTYAGRGVLMKNWNHGERDRVV